MVEYAALLLNRFEIGKDGKTAYERHKGKKARALSLKFGEACDVEEKACRRNLREVVAPVGGWHIPGCEGRHW